MEAVDTDVLIHIGANAEKAFAVFAEVSSRLKALYEQNKKLFDGLSGIGSGGTGKPKSPVDDDTIRKTNAFSREIVKLTLDLSKQSNELTKSREETEKLVGSNARVTAAYTRREAQINTLSRQLQLLKTLDNSGVVSTDKLGGSMSVLADRVRVANASFNAQEESLRRIGQNMPTIANEVQKTSNRILELSAVAQTLSQVGNAFNQYTADFERGKSGDKFGCQF
jgi:chromosome segregation ATPase